MSSKSIKIDILVNFILAVIISIIITLGLEFTVIFIVHILNLSAYTKFVDLYNNDSGFMLLVLLVNFIVFILIMSFIFMKRMNIITDYIKKISTSVNEVSKGNMDIEIPINSHNELGDLAQDINEMVLSIKSFIDKEREWEKSKNNLITNVSHDLRTPLTSIIGFIELIKNRRFKDDNEFEHYCEVAFIKSKELKYSIDQLFEFTKVTNNDIKLNKNVFCINELIQQVTMGFIPLFQENHMKYRISSNNSKIDICADANLIVRVFENIISNAIKYGSSGEFLDIILGREGDKAVINFVNYGDMISEKDLIKLFEKFYRVEKKSNKKEGTGLGLAISKTIVEMHGGSIRVNSSKEKTEFKVII